MAATKTSKPATPGRKRAGAQGRLGRTRRQSHAPNGRAGRFSRPAALRTAPKPATGTDLVVYTPPVEHEPLTRRVRVLAAQSPRR